MARRLPSLNALKAFETAARHESFSDGAAELFVTHAAVSRHIRDLEDYLGTELFTRTGRGVTLTEAGRRFGQQLTPLFDRLAEASREAAAVGQARSLKVSLEPAIASRWLVGRLGKFNESSPYYEAALKASPGDPEIFCDRGYSLCLQGRDTEAETALRQAIAKKPDMPRAHNNLGLLLGRSGRAPEALTEFRKAGCPEADAELNLAFALGQNRRWSEAKEHVEIARSLGANLPNVKEGVAEIDALIARAEAAPTSLAGSDPAVLRAKATQSVPK